MWEDKGEGREQVIRGLPVIEELYGKLNADVNRIRASQAKLHETRVLREVNVGPETRRAENDLSPMSAYSHGARYPRHTIEIQSGCSESYDRDENLGGQYIDRKSGIVQGRRQDVPMW